MNIWHSPVDMDALNTMAEGCLNGALGIRITEAGDDVLRGTMPVDERTVQPAGVLHGGASVAFAETLASWAAYLTVDTTRFHAVGQEINANHLRPAAAGTQVIGEARPIMRGRRSQVWDIRIQGEDGKLVCICRCTMAIVEVPGRYTDASNRPAPSAG